MLLLGVVILLTILVIELIVFVRLIKKRILFTGFVAGTLLMMAGLSMLIRGDYSDLQLFSLDNRINDVASLMFAGGLGLSRAVLSVDRNSNDNYTPINNGIETAGYGE